MQRVPHRVASRVACTAARPITVVASFSNDGARARCWFRWAASDANLDHVVRVTHRSVIISRKLARHSSHVATAACNEVSSTQSPTYNEGTSSTSAYFGRRGEPAELLHWFKANGGRCHDCLEVCDIGGGIGWGLCLADGGAGCSAGSVLTWTPPHLLFAADEPDEDAGIEPLIRGERFPAASKSLRDKLAAAAASAANVDGSGVFDMWVRAVRLPPGQPLLIADQVPNGLRDTPLFATALALRAALRAESAPRVAGARLDPMIWAQAALMSRAAVLPRDGSRLVLAPIADFANHAASFADANAELRYEDSGAVTLIARRAIAAGEEIRHCYAELSNEQLLFSYGTVLEGNPHGGPACHLPPPVPTSKARAAAWYRGLGAAGPSLRSHGTPGVDDPAEELLLAFCVLHLSEREAASLLNDAAPAGANPDGCRQASLRGLLQPGTRELWAATLFLDRWEACLWRPDCKEATLDEEAIGPVTRWQAEVLAAVVEARDSVVTRLPWLWRLRRFLRLHLAGVSPTA
eukprot:TRINITY_DN67455_c0_g1_i1.p1 TRINITY_DN67455_c0_g1~~TRINITY_DN67455_c0_g1_i1.p1  ORF type:complete len:522 (+),score=63.65 TRINITY_DN67455_c0_g1_i1:80-1645(+)